MRHRASSLLCLAALAGVVIVSSALASPPSPAKGAVEKSAAAAGKVERFGAPITAAPRQSLAAVLAEPAAHAGKTVLVEGQVRRACTRKGCWMEMATAADPAAPGCRVTFKDYGFFVPLDAAGSRVLVEGTVEVETVAASDVRHLEGEGATFAAKQPDGSAREVHLVATGVELRRP